MLLANSTTYQLQAPAPDDFKIGDLLLIDRGHPQAVDSVDDQGNTVAADQQYSELSKLLL